MSEKRTPVITFYIKIRGKKTEKVECFKVTDFPTYSISTGPNRDARSCFRLRVNGKWFPKGQKVGYWKSDIRNMLFRSINFNKL